VPVPTLARLATCNKFGTFLGFADGRAYGDGMSDRGLPMPKRDDRREPKQSVGDGVREPEQGQGAARPEVVDVCQPYRDKRRQHGQRLARLAAEQHGVVSAEQLSALGLTRNRVADLVTEGRLHRLYRGVYAVGHVKLTRDGRLSAALLAAGDGAFLSHRTAAALHGLRNLNLRRIDVTVVGSSGRPRSGLVLHRTTKPPARGELTTVNGLLVSTVPRLLVELAQTETEAELRRMITIAVRKQAFSHERLRQAIADHPTQPGINNLTAAYAAYRPRPDRKSDLERAFDRLLDEHPEIPEPLRNVYLDRWELDYYWPEYSVVLELDGRPYHLVVEKIESDRLKDAYLLARGIRPLRVTDERFEHDPGGALSDLKALLRLGARRPPT
jgi:hypothetical protein